MSYVRKCKKYAAAQCTAVEWNQCNNAQCALSSQALQSPFSAIWCSAPCNYRPSWTWWCRAGPAVHSFAITISYSHDIPSLPILLPLMTITVHLGLDDVKLVLGAAADDLHLILANLLDQGLLKRIFWKKLIIRAFWKGYFEGSIIRTFPNGYFDITIIFWCKYCTSRSPATSFEWVSIDMASL